MSDLFDRYLQEANYQIDDSGSLSNWSSIPNARHFDSFTESGCLGIIFNSETREVYELTATGEAGYAFGPVAYRWVNPDYLKAYRAEHETKGFDWKDFSELDYVDLETPDDLFEKGRAILDNVDFDRRVQIPLELEDDVIYELMKKAHERDITFNALIEELVLAAITQVQQSGAEA